MSIQKRTPHTNHPIARETQAQLIQRLRDERHLDGPLVVYPAPRPESGPSCDAYYRDKFRRGEVGRFWLHHVRGWF
jgi:hypothetical protein